MKRFAFALLALAFASPAPAQTADARVRAALALAAAAPQPAACTCPVTGVCTCRQCSCGLPGYEAIYARARRESLPLVIFAGLDRRDVAGCVTVGYDRWCSPTQCYPHNIIVGTAGATTFSFKVLPATATDAQIRAAAEPPLALAPGEHSHQCPSCGWQWKHGDAERLNVASHTCPNCGAGPIWDVHQRAARPVAFAALPRMAAWCPT